MTAQDTIAAIATPPGNGGIGIIRLSGPQALSIGEAITHSSLQTGRILFRHFFDDQDNVIDHGLCLVFKGPHSFSGEDSVELQGHGGAIVLDMVLQRACELGARLARAGEFSERAFLNGRIDLTQAEAIADLIESGSRAASRAAMRSLQGQFSDKVRKLVDQLIELRAYLEAAMDFTDEEIDLLSDSDVTGRLQVLLSSVEQLLREAEQGRTLQEGISISLAGLPNAGKSSLLNWLAGYEAAIVTDIEGTTRDVLRENLSLKGIPVRVNDTAGLRETSHPVEQEGIRRARHEIDQSDLVLYLVDSSKGLSKADEANLRDLQEQEVLVVYTKVDLLDGESIFTADGPQISVKSGEGVEALIDQITHNRIDFNQQQETMIARRRHVEALRQSLDYLSNALPALQQVQSVELVAEDLRLAQQTLNEITGEFSTEDLLGKIFSSFCIGK